MLEIREARCGYPLPQGKTKTVLESISFSISKGDVLCILGANGVGKSTLFKSILGSLPLLGGDVSIDERSLGKMTRREIAHRIGYVPQFHTPPFPYTVEQVVVMGRVAHLPIYEAPSKADIAIADKALTDLGIGHLREDLYTEISGGERQMVLIARALAQQADYIVMDEPTSNLDLHNQTLVLQQIERLAELGIGVIMTTHHPNHAFLCATSLLLIRGRADYQFGSPEELITADCLESLFGVEVRLVTTQNKSGKAVISVVSYI